MRSTEGEASTAASSSEYSDATRSSTITCVFPSPTCSPSARSAPSSNDTSYGPACDWITSGEPSDTGEASVRDHGLPAHEGVLGPGEPCHESRDLGRLAESADRHLLHEACD